MRKKVMSALFGMAMAIVVLAGCSSQSSTATETSVDGTESETSVETKIVGTSNTLAPYVYLDEDGNLTGYDYDILVELDERLEDYEFEYSPADFSTNLVSIQSGAIDMMVNNLVQSKERKELYLFPEHYSTLAPMCLAVQVGSGITGLTDLDGKDMNQNPSSYEYTLVKSWMEDNPDTAINIVAVSDLTTADNLKQVSNGTVDAALTYEATFETVMETLDGVDNLVTTDVVLCEDVYYMFNNTQQDFCDAVDEALGEMYEDGFMSENSIKWFGEDIFEKYADMISITFD